MQGEREITRNKVCIISFFLSSTQLCLVLSGVILYCLFLYILLCMCFYIYIYINNQNDWRQVGGSNKETKETGGHQKSIPVCWTFSFNSSKWKQEERKLGLDYLTHDLSKRVFWECGCSCFSKCFLFRNTLK